MLDMKTRASVKLGNPMEFNDFMLKAMGISQGDDGRKYFVDGTDVSALFRFMFPFARLVAIEKIGSQYINYAVFRCEEDAVEFKLKYL